MNLCWSGMAWWWRSLDCVNFFYRSVFHHSVWFVCLFGVFYIIPYCLICSSPSGRLHNWRAWRPPFLCFAFSVAISWRFLGDPWSFGRWSSLGEFTGALYRSVPSALISTGFFHHPRSRSVASIATRLLGASLASPVLRVCLFSEASLACLLNFWSSDRMRRSGIL